MANKRDLKAYVRYDANGRLIAGSLILQRFKPKVGNWQEIQAYECCNFIPTTTTTSTTSIPTTTTTSTTSIPTTTTTTTTTPPVQQYRISSTRCQGCPNGCSEDINNGTYVYAAGPAYATPRQLYTDAGLTTPFTTTNGLYALMQGFPSGTLYTGSVQDGILTFANPC